MKRDEIGPSRRAGTRGRKVPVAHLDGFAVRGGPTRLQPVEGVHGKRSGRARRRGIEFAGVPVTGASLWTIAACLQGGSNGCSRRPVCRSPGGPSPGKDRRRFPLPRSSSGPEDASPARPARSSPTQDAARPCRRDDGQFDEVLVQEYVAGRELTSGSSDPHPPHRRDRLRPHAEGAGDPHLRRQVEAGSPDDLGRCPCAPPRFRRTRGGLGKVAEAASGHAGRLRAQWTSELDDQASLVLR